MPLPRVGGWNYLRALASSSAAWMALIVRSLEVVPLQWSSHLLSYLGHGWRVFSTVRNGLRMAVLRDDVSGRRTSSLVETRGRGTSHSCQKIREKNSRELALYRQLAGSEKKAHTSCALDF